ncbi:MAG: xanthine dehydrogenase accessory protein XdhC [Hyphomicrobiales bacterium]|nr:xanthine dehydrogenase accessory protein XdhC [Hyphomicrobiales bacterium]MDE2115176.1 xanthine dehydrogenase accessory protein XdhC [Hyphomicrobiales bacterium]
MTLLSMELASLLARHESAAIVEITQTEGSTPREAGAQMLVSAHQSFGTIGGGHLEFHAIDMARAMLAGGEDQRELTLHLGPQMGQCCGGRVQLKLWRAKSVDVTDLARLEAQDETALPDIAIFGAGHTGQALARQLAHLPFKVRLIDDRIDTLATVCAPILPLQHDHPGDLIADLPIGTAVVVLTHSHALDYTILAAALRRHDFAYVGMIGSQTKKARFASWFMASGGTRPALSRLTCPIGGADVKDKRPAIIAALTAAELVRALLHK